MKQRYPFSHSQVAELGSWLMLMAATLLLMTILLMPLNALGLTKEEQRLKEAWQQGELVRLHILAEDDSKEAQQVKLIVRDSILATFGEKLKALGLTNSDQVYAYLLSHADEMEQVALSAAREAGFDGEVRAQVGVMDLPSKQYGDVLLPSGPYRALRITLGAGQGQNWWCILFPQLCLALAGDEPWQTEPEEPPRPVFYTLDILSCWTLLAP
ncbi:MAG: hypothetical protein E7319_06430 [Clostridiales bacterium]|nr:hypothetical protein [Clostridiales bacterium]